MKRITTLSWILASAIILAISTTAPAQPPADPQADITVDRQRPDQQGEQAGQPYGDQQAGLEDKSEAVKTVQAATRVLMDIFNQPDQKITASELENAFAVGIIPDVVKASLIAGGRHGTGVLLARNQNDPNEWSPPVFFSVTGGSLGAQLGVESSDLILVFQDREKLNALLQDNEFELGVDASVAAGTAGAKAKASTRDAEVLSYQRTEGLFAGVALTGSVLSIDEELTMAYYDLNEQTVRGYYGDEQRMAQAILGLQLPAETAGQSGQRFEIQQIPASARNLQEALKHFASNAR